MPCSSEPPNLTGRVKTTIVSGKVVYANGKMV
jgi:dihydroorotase-like cyclic amidohydrolase